MKFPKTPRYQNKQYRRYVASKACFGCGIEGYSQAAHRNGGGMGTKHSDLEIFPLCATRPGHMGCHTQFDLLVDLTRDQRRELEAIYVNRMQDMAREDRRPEFIEDKAA